MHLREGCKDNVSIKQTFSARPARHPCGLVPCTTQNLQSLIGFAVVATRIYLPASLFGSHPRPSRLHEHGHKAKHSEAQRGKSFDVLRSQHLTEFFSLVWLLDQERPMSVVHDQTLDINSVHRFGALASLNPPRMLHNLSKAGLQSP